MTYIEALDAAIPTSYLLAALGLGWVITLFLAILFHAMYRDANRDFFEYVAYANATMRDLCLSKDRLELELENVRALLCTCVDEREALRKRADVAEANHKVLADWWKAEPPASSRRAFDPLP